MYRLPLYFGRRELSRTSVHNLPASPTHSQASQLYSMSFYEFGALPKHITRRLAAELYDRFLDHLHFSKSTLSTCSVVCKSWLPTTRYHLFFEINLTPDLVQSIQSSNHAMETVAPYLRNVELCGAWMSRKRDVDHIISFLLELDNVQGLCMETWSWNDLNNATSDMLIKAQGNFFGKIKTLHLKYAHFPSFSTLTQFIQAFPMIEDLAFDNVTWDHEEHPLSSSLPPALVDTVKAREQDMHDIRLTALHIRCCLIKPILRWLFNVGRAGPSDPNQEQSIPLIRILSLPEILPSETNEVAAALRTLGPFLQHVDLGFMSYGPYGPPLQGLHLLGSTYFWHDILRYASFILDPSECVDLSFNSNLQSIHIRQLTLYQFPDRNPGTLHNSPTWSAPRTGGSNVTSQYFWISPLLSTVSSNQILELAFTVWLSAERQLDLIDWTALSDVLGKPNFLTLKTFKVEILGMGGGQEQVKGWLLKRLGRWAPAETVLQVSFIDE